MAFWPCASWCNSWRRHWGQFLLRNRKGVSNLPFKMWAYPLPVIISILIWLFVFFSTGVAALWAIGLIGVGVAVYYLKDRLMGVGQLKS